ncbi:histidinolphosphatase [Ascosphaera atra]|nr:histidinolphosphatase [Ascosphaera atra]
MYEAARTKAGGTDEALFSAYFDEQYDLLKTLRPPVIGHFDLIRLYSEEPNASMKRFTGVWEKVMRNLEFIASYGGVMELNFASLRKGMTEPYPKADICQEFLAMNGRFCLSDDSHGVSQVGLNYHHVLPYLESTGIQEIYYLEHLPAEKRRSASTEGDSVFDERFPSTALRRMDMSTLKAQPFWTKVAGK